MLTKSPHRSWLPFALGFIALGFIALTAGCATSTESAERDALTAHVGVYPAPPPGIWMPRVGVPPFKVTGAAATQAMEAHAADQLTSLSTVSHRFHMIERSQLQQLFDEQDLEGIVKEGELARPSEVRGVDYLFFGRVTNFRVKMEKATRGLGLAKIPVLGEYAGAGDYEKKSVKITTDCGVDLRLVDPSSGEIMASHFGEFRKSDAMDAFGIEILGANAEADVEMEFSDDDKGKILRLALDEALRKMLPDVDAFLLRQAHERKPAPPDFTSASDSDGARPQFCTSCGAGLAKGAGFCGKCGHKVTIPDS